ncbi:MAG: hypothetical protein J6Y58_08540 [Clostridiales bacterium]|nr:hypothetical protein [Clostridiales bacterium]
MTTGNKTVVNKLNFADFMKAFHAQYTYGMPDLKNFMISEQVVHKNNRNLHGIIIRRPGTRIAPVFYYEDFYDAYKNGATIEECIMKMTSFVMDRDFTNECLGEVFSSWEKVKDQLIVKLINFNKNREQLMKVPYRVFGDMAVVVQIYLDDPSIGKGAVMVDRTLLDIWKKDTEELFDVAFENMKKYRIKAINLLDFDIEEKINNQEAPDIYVVSYDAPFPGASALLQTQYFKTFATMKDADFYVLPVSVHEVLLIQKNKEIVDDMLFGMLHGINSDKNLSDNMLSDEVFYLDRKADNIEYLLGGKELLMMDPCA